MPTFKDLKNIIVEGVRDTYDVSKEIVKEKTNAVNSAIVSGVVTSLKNDPEFKLLIRDIMKEMMNTPINEDRDPEDVKIDND